MPEPHHHLDIDTHAGALHVHARLDLTQPWTVLFGPSGSGKTTLLRAIAGLLPPSATAIVNRFTPTREDLTHLPPQKRGLAYAPQQAAIFPHLTVSDNIRFPVHVCGDGPGDISIVEDAVTLFRLHTLAPRMPAALSGGERQRVSLARAFATPKTRLLLLDEPFSGLDRPSRDELLPLMRAHCLTHNIPVLSVTHDVDEALLLDAEVLRLDNGHIVAQGPAHQVLAEDRNRLLAALR